MKLRHKLIVAMLCLLALVYGVGGCTMISLTCSDALNRARESAVASYRLVCGMIQSVNAWEGAAGTGILPSLLDQLSRQNPAWSALRLFDGGELVFAYRAGDLPTPTVKAESAVSLFPLTTPQGGNALLLEGRFYAQDAPLCLQMAFDVTEVYALRARQQAAYRGIFLFMLFSGAILAWMTVWRLTRPLSQLSQATRELTAGNLSYRFPYDSQDEVGQVASDFNQMAQTLEANMDAMAESLERQERFAGSFAHELKTPMTSVIGYADLLRSGMLDPDESREAANYIFSEGRRLERLSGKLLELLVVQKEPPVLQPVRMKPFVESIAEKQRPVFEKQGISLTCTAQEGVCRIEPDLTVSLLLNLLDNARKALPNGGDVRLTCEMTAEGCRLSVADNGPGIPAEALPHLQEPFFRVDKARSRQQGGAGLGLALCSRIAQVHGGQLRFDSVPGQGATATAELKGGRA